MERRKHCNPEDMVMFLLALCCQDDDSPTPVSRNKDLDKLFHDCYSSILLITNRVGLRKRLET